MESYFLPGFQLPFQSRLSRLYDDTKKSSDFVMTPLQNAEDPEIKALHRKLRIQKDRLVSWGLEWSDPSAQPSNEVLIDSSISRAGLSEVVSSIMSTIKETLAEVEPLWASSKRLVGDTEMGSGKLSALTGPEEKAASADRKLPIVTWDKARFADLVHDLTVSIDTLYDLSRTRSNAATAAAAKLAAAWSSTSPKGGEDELRPFESSRMQVPQQISPLTLTGVESARPDLEAASSAGGSAADVLHREVVFMSKQAYADLARPHGKQSYSPLLLEYAYFDPVYSNTGIMPSMARFEKLSSGLQTAPQRAPDSWSGIPSLLGYFEDMENSRLGLVYQFPPTFQAVVPSEGTSLHIPTSQNPRSCLYSLGDLLGSPGFEPRLEAKFRLAANLSNTIFDMHARGIVHGNLLDSSILFGILANNSKNDNANNNSNNTPTQGSSGSSGSSAAAGVSHVDIRKPFISSFEVFPDSPPTNKQQEQLQASSSSPHLYRHPLNAQALAAGGAPPMVDTDPRVFDLYSLAMILLSIGMWTKLENLVPHPKYSTSVSEAVLDQLGTQCGTLYMKAVQTCWNAMETLMAAKSGTGDVHLQRVQLRVTRYLEACCILDGVSNLEERLGIDLGPAPGSAEDVRAASSATSTGAAASAAHAASAPPVTSASSTIDTTARKMPLMQRHRTVPVPSKARLERTSTDEYFRTGQRDDFKDFRDFKDFKAPLDSSAPLVASIPEAAPVVPRSTNNETTTAVPAKSDRPRMRLYPQVPLPPDVVDNWHSLLMPQINYALRHFYRSHPESVEISLESVGDSPRNTRPTVLVVCTSVAKVRSILKRKVGHMFEGTSAIGLKVCSGRVLRSRKRGAKGVTGESSGDVRRSQDSSKSSDDASVGSSAGSSSSSSNQRQHITAANSQFQARPQNGASIGAWIGDRHLPPVSFGGLLLVDEKPFGMTVHHMLDDPDAVELVASRGGETGVRNKALRSSSSAAAAAAAAAAAQEEIEELGQSILDWYAELQADSSVASTSGEDDFACEFSDTNSNVSESDITSEYWSDSDDGKNEGDEEYDDEAEPGDTPGIEPGYGDGYVVTQPALDDVDGAFYPDAETQDDDHLDSCGLGDIYASSGVRRRVDEHGLVHEIDWALFEFREERRPPENSIPHLPLGGGGGGKGNRAQDRHDRSERSDKKSKHMLHPTTVAPSTALPGLEVQCMARTSGLQTGKILPTLTSVKIFGRVSPSHTYQISGAGGGWGRQLGKSGARQAPIGIPGDSGAWIVEREHGRLCGHVLAWSERKRVAYLCPMDVLLLDIAETLEAGEIRLPGGEAVVKIRDAEERRKSLTTASGAGGGGGGGGSQGPGGSGGPGNTRPVPPTPSTATSPNKAEPHYYRSVWDKPPSTPSSSARGGGGGGGDSTSAAASGADGVEERVEGLRGGGGDSSSGSGSGCSGSCGSSGSVGSSGGSGGAGGVSFDAINTFEKSHFEDPFDYHHQQQRRLAHKNSSTTLLHSSPSMALLEREAARRDLEREAARRDLEAVRDSEPTRDHSSSPSMALLNRQARDSPYSSSSPSLSLLSRETHRDLFGETFRDLKQTSSSSGASTAETLWMPDESANSSSHNEKGSEIISGVMDEGGDPQGDAGGGASSGSDGGAGDKGSGPWKETKMMTLVGGLGNVPFPGNDVRTTC